MSGVTEEDLKKAIKEAIRLKGLASEYQGNHGKHVSNVVERHGMEKTAFTFSRRLVEMEEGKRQAIVRACLDYWNKLGFFDQIDAFDDLLDTINEIREKALTEAPAGGDDTLDSLSAA